MVWEIQLENTIKYFIFNLEKLTNTTISQQKGTFTALGIIYIIAVLKIMGYLKTNLCIILLMTAVYEKKAEKSSLFDILLETSRQDSGQESHTAEFQFLREGIHACLMNASAEWVTMAKYVDQKSLLSATITCVLLHMKSCTPGYKRYLRCQADKLDSRCAHRQNCPPQVRKFHFMCARFILSFNTGVENMHPNCTWEFIVPHGFGFIMTVRKLRTLAYDGICVYGNLGISCGNNTQFMHACGTHQPWKRVLHHNMVTVKSQLDMNKTSTIPYRAELEFEIEALMRTYL